MKEIVTPIRFAVVSTLPSASTNTGAVLEQGGSLWFSDGASWIDLGASSGASAPPWGKQIAHAALRF